MLSSNPKGRERADSAALIAAEARDAQKLVNLFAQHVQTFPDHPLAGTVTLPSGTKFGFINDNPVRMFTRINEGQPEIEIHFFPPDSYSQEFLGACEDSSYSNPVSHLSQKVLDGSGVAIKVNAQGSRLVIQATKILIMAGKRIIDWENLDQKRNVHPAIMGEIIKNIKINPQTQKEKTRFTRGRVLETSPEFLQNDFDPDDLFH